MYCFIQIVANCAMCIDLVAPRIINSYHRICHLTCISLPVVAIMWPTGRLFCHYTSKINWKNLNKMIENSK